MQKEEHEQLRLMVSMLCHRINLPEFVASEVGCTLMWKNGGRSATIKCPMSWHNDNKASFFMNQMDDGAWVYHCLSGNTRVITEHGIYPINELAGTTQTILSYDGRWIKSPFYNFGKQMVSKIILSRNGQKKEIFATNKHRWFVVRSKNQNRELTTSMLKKGHCLAWSFPKNSSKKLARRGWVVKDVILNVCKEEVFCAVVPETHSFTLEDNILTGNCFGCEAKGTVVNFCIDYLGHEDKAEAVAYLVEKYNIEGITDEDLMTYRFVVNSIDERRKLECANISSSSQCRELLRNDFEKNKNWVAKAYRRLNKALEAKDIVVVEDIGHEASSRILK